MLKNYILLYDPFKLSGTDGFLNYKMSGFGSGNKNGTSNNGTNNNGGFVIIIIIIVVFLLFKTCGE